MLRLKIAAMILFWFGVIWQFLAVIHFVLEYYHYRTFFDIDVELIFSEGIPVTLFFIHFFVHVQHIIGGYWLSRGKRAGVILGVSVSLYEIVSFLVPEVTSVLLTPEGITIRILFAIVIFLIVSGRKELTRLQSENWRPWKNPRTTDKTSS